MSINALSLFANVGISECYLSGIGVNIVVANELEEVRSKFYSHVYPDSNMITGDITTDEIFNKVIEESRKNNVEMIIATPPCQGMSIAGRRNPTDARNTLIKHVVRAVKELNPKYVFLENVPQQLKTKVDYNGDVILIPDYLKAELGDMYGFNNMPVVDAADYGVPQVRKRAIILLTRRDLPKQWEVPAKELERKSLKDAIGHLPSLDPRITDMSEDEVALIFPEYEKKKEVGERVSRWHTPPAHVYRQIVAMQHTPTNASAHSNPDCNKPQKKDGTIVKGFATTYKRQDWDRPAYTITMSNSSISSQNNVHPGYLLESGLYSDARVLSVYELLLVMTLPEDWDIPDWVSSQFLRSVIGEGIPPLLMKKIMANLPRN